jgi:hypothetical protein
MNIKKLDSEITLYEKNTLSGAIEILEEINRKQSQDNIWQIASNNNINNTNIAVNSEILYLTAGDSFLNEKRKLSELLNEYSLPFILHYLSDLELSIKSIKPWTICKNIKNHEFHSDETKNKTKHQRCIIVFLNDEYAGGGLHFKDRIGNESITFNTGDVIIYPSNEEHIHKALPITEGTQYVAITYF